MANDNTPPGNNPPSSNDNPNPTRNNQPDRNRDQLREVFDRYAGTQQNVNQRQNNNTAEGIVNLLNRTRRDLGDLRNLTQARLRSSITNKDSSTLNIGNNPLNDTSALEEHSRVQSQTLISMDGKLEDLLLSQRVVQRDVNKTLYGVIELLSRKNRDDDEGNTIIINNYYDGDGSGGDGANIGFDVDLDRRRRGNNRRPGRQNRPSPQQRPAAPGGRPPGSIGGMVRVLLGRAVTAGATTAAAVVGTVAAIGGAFRLSEALTPESQMGAQRRAPEEIQTLINQNRSVRFTQDVDPFKKDDIVDIRRVLSTFGYSENDALEGLRQLLNSRQIELVPQGQTPQAAPQAAPVTPAPATSENSQDITRRPGESTRDFNRRVRENQQRLADQNQAAPVTPQVAAPVTSQQEIIRNASERYLEAQDTLSRTENEIAEFRNRHGAPRTVPHRDPNLRGFMDEEVYDDPEIQEQYQTLIRGRRQTSQQRGDAFIDAQVNLVGGTRNNNIVNTPDGSFQSMSLEEKARAIDLLKTRYGYTDEQLRSFGGGPSERNFIAVNGVRYSRQVIGLFREMLRKELSREITPQENGTSQAAAPVTPAPQAAPEPATPPAAQAAPVTPAPQAAPEPAARIQNTQNVNIGLFREKDPEGFREYDTFVRRRTRELVRNFRPSATDYLGQSLELDAYERQARELAREEANERFRDRLNAAGARTSTTEIQGTQTNLQTQATPVQSAPGVPGVRMGRSFDQGLDETPTTPQAAPTASAPQVAPTPQAASAPQVAPAASAPQVAPTAPAPQAAPTAQFASDYFRVSSLGTGSTAQATPTGINPPTSLPPTVAQVPRQSDENSARYRINAQDYSINASRTLTFTAGKIVFTSSDIVIENESGRSIDQEQNQQGGGILSRVASMFGVGSGSGRSGNAGGGTSGSGGAGGSASPGGMRRTDTTGATGRTERTSGEGVTNRTGTGGQTQPISGMEDVKAMVIEHEGIRYEPYRDSLGKWTVGVGHLIGDGSSPGPYAGRRLSHAEVMQLFEEDFAKHVRIAERTPGWSKANQTGQAAMIDLAFNMGQWWPRWPNTSKALAEGDWETAAKGLEDSRWYRQVGRRAPKIVNMIRSAGNGATPSGDAGGQVASITPTVQPSGDTDNAGPRARGQQATVPTSGPDNAQQVSAAPPTNAQGMQGAQQTVADPVQEGGEQGQQGQGQQDAQPADQQGGGTEGLTFAPQANPNIKPEIANIVKRVQAAVGAVTVISGYRDPARNSRVGGATNSKHMTGEAVDIQFAGGMNVAPRAIQVASKAGVGGVGVYDRWVHLDTGPKRTWQGRGGQPWAQQVLAAHMSGRASEITPNAGGAAGGTMVGAAPTAGRDIGIQSMEREVGQTTPAPTATPAPAPQNMAAPEAGGGGGSNGVGGGLDIGSVHPAPGLMAEFSRESSQPSIIRPPSAMGMGLHRTPSFTA